MVPGSVYFAPIGFLPEPVTQKACAAFLQTVQIMMSEADPTLLAELCATLLGERVPGTHASPQTRDSPRSRPSSRENSSGSGRVTSKRTGPRSVGPLRARDGNASPKFGLGGAGDGTGIDGVASAVPGSKGRRLGTPTKSSLGGSRMPERKIMRKVSPQKKKVTAPKALSLSEDQQRVVDLVVQDRSVFFTGERKKRGNRAHGLWRGGEGYSWQRMP